MSMTRVRLKNPYGFVELHTRTRHGSARCCAEEGSSLKHRNNHAGNVILLCCVDCTIRIFETVLLNEEVLSNDAAPDAPVWSASVCLARGECKEKGLRIITEQDDPQIRDKRQPCKRMRETAEVKGEDLQYVWMFFVSIRSIFLVQGW